jgi:hypothetical protein
MKTRVVARWNGRIGRDEFHIEELVPEHERFNSYASPFTRGENESPEEWHARHMYTVPAEWEFRMVTPDRAEAIEIAERIASGGKPERIITEFDFP